MALRGDLDDSRQLLGVHSEALFADPLGLRSSPGGGSQAGGRFSPHGSGMVDPSMRSASDMSSPGGQKANDGGLNWGATWLPWQISAAPVLSSVGEALFGSRSCCGYRDSASAEAAAVARATGRPPMPAPNPQRKEAFPMPSGKDWESESCRSGVSHPAHDSNYGARGHDTGAGVGPLVTAGDLDAEFAAASAPMSSRQMAFESVESQAFAGSLRQPEPAITGASAAASSSSRTASKPHPHDPYAIGEAPRKGGLDLLTPGADAFSADDYMKSRNEEAQRRQQLDDRRRQLQEQREKEEREVQLRREAREAEDRRRAQEEREREERDARSRREAERAEERLRQRREEEAMAAGPPAAHVAPSANCVLPKRWEWPAWALDKNKPCIQVWVEDEDAGSKWCDAVPLTRVVGEDGTDAFLAVQYQWDGECFDQDFGPEHVRRRGEASTVKEYLLRAPGASPPVGTSASVLGNDTVTMPRNNEPRAPPHVGTSSSVLGNDTVTMPRNKDSQSASSSSAAGAGALLTENTVMMPRRGDAERAGASPPQVAGNERSARMAMDDAFLQGATVMMPRRKDGAVSSSSGNGNKETASPDEALLRDETVRMNRRPDAELGDTMQMQRGPGQRAQQAPQGIEKAKLERYLKGIEAEVGQQKKEAPERAAKFNQSRLQERLREAEAKELGF
eukprot:TRINITY_DN101022_c0_g1_i1.p1 TRINITY_DN101022_c0_g1~~TRINITY_DN101022_c0_g1_i1.p1  ORF type:complete len:679 (-),score=165.85 TRINITY_DN101022_c0_g1_i1:60-2096(-)